MADNTGAPHFIPYVEPTDLVREYPAADEASAFAVAAALDGIPVLAGIGSNVVQAVKSDTFSASLAQGAVTAITGLTVAITPSSDTAKVLVIATVGGGVDLSGLNFIVKRDSTSLALGDADGSTSRRTYATGFGNEFSAATSTFMFVDSPATASSVTYSVEVGHDVGATRTVFVNRPVNTLNASSRSRTSSTITAIEVAA